jgi:hypothetical protein
MKFAFAATLFGVCALGAPAEAALVTYYFNTSGFTNGSTVDGSLSIDLDAVANPSNITLAELNTLADYSFTVNPVAIGGIVQPSFVLTDENSTWAFGQTGNRTIAATPTQLTFDISNGLIRVTRDDQAILLWDTLTFQDLNPGSNAIMQITNQTVGTGVDQRNYGTVTPSFTFAASVPEPSSMLLVGMASGIGLALRRRRSAVAEPASNSSVTA